MTSIRSIMAQPCYEGVDWDDLEASVQRTVTEQAVKAASTANERLKYRFNNLQTPDGVKAIQEQAWLVMILTRWFSRRKRSQKSNKNAKQSPNKRKEPVCSTCEKFLVCPGCSGLEVCIVGCVSYCRQRSDANWTPWILFCRLSPLHREQSMYPPLRSVRVRTQSPAKRQPTYRTVAKQSHRAIVAKLAEPGMDQKTSTTLSMAPQRTSLTKSMLLRKTTDRTMAKQPCPAIGMNQKSSLTVSMAPQRTSLRKPRLLRKTTDRTIERQPYRAILAKPVEAGMNQKSSLTRSMAPLRTSPTKLTLPPATSSTRPKNMTNGLTNPIHGIPIYTGVCFPPKSSGFAGCATGICKGVVW